jgi:ACR3 family arsenite transporter
VTGSAGPRRLAGLERHLTLWVAVCMGAGVALGAVGALREIEVGPGSRINAAIAVLLWLMIYPMMLRVDLASLAAMLRFNLLTYRDLWAWLDAPFHVPVVEPAPDQLVLLPG